MDHVCSLGTNCLIADILKVNSLKRCSYPFDWIYSDPSIIESCLEDDFSAFLNKSYYTPVSENQCGHSFYKKVRMFNHFNPCDKEEHYQYYLRCVSRFRDLLKSDGKKLFIIGFPNLEDVGTRKESIRKLDSTLRKYTSSYEILCLFHLSKQDRLRHEIQKEENITYLTYYTKTLCTGVQFEDVSETVYLRNLIKSLYIYNITPTIKDIDSISLPKVLNK